APDPRASGEPRWRPAPAQAVGAGGPGARLQLRLLPLEKGLRAEEALPGAHEEYLSARRHPPQLPQAPRPGPPAGVLVRYLPAPLRAGAGLRVRAAARSTRGCRTSRAPAPGPGPARRGAGCPA